MDPQPLLPAAHAKPKSICTTGPDGHQWCSTGICNPPSQWQVQGDSLVCVSPTMPPPPPAPSGTCTITILGDAARPELGPTVIGNSGCDVAGMELLIAMALAKILGGRF
jgi:hypothetical protein